MIFEKPLSPAHVGTMVEGNRDTIAGFVLNAADVAQMKSPRELYEAHGLGFPGSPWDPAAGYLDVLRFQAPPSVYVHSATAPEFVDRPPFTGTGFARWGGGVAPVWFLDECRIPPRAQLWRIREGQQDQLLAMYIDAASGWGILEGSGISSPAHTVPQTVIGWVAVWDGFQFPADVVGDKAVLAAASEPPAEITGFRRTMRGCWSREVPVSELDDLFEVNAVCRWQGHPFRITDVAHDGGARIFRLFYTGHNADVAESLGLNKADAGVYWTVQPESAVTDVEMFQNRLKPVAG
ncbi:MULTISPECIES: hypothetical protein [Arthrobacter]|uniref:Uncharacterized protein n=1 Tax=Arthrobacter jinronghuae TaxID=2964609 RepID=A0ABT1NUV4_9MICC|nr:MULTISPECIES: hypothetical protein [Arthrobacter]MCQ1951518.1 hypothetical protein [Arthrobacter jinronghuae]MCQ1954698.1 hypothetical protein [Arthrobacter sp. zg-Y238]UWX79596.1 hypothetical protein N2K98_05175 [Arthrobacter jinronghuae]